MTVIFQLFCVEDLKRLGEDGRQELRTIIRKHLPAPPAPPRGSTASRRPRETSKLTLEASRNTRLHFGEETPPQILKAIEKRYDEVSEQLKSPLPEGPADASNLDPKRDLLPQLTNPPPKLGSLNPAAEKEIVEWAISCEVNNYNFYYPLLEIKEEAYAMFERRTNQRPKGPDSLYSPFNPLHPLYDLFSELKTYSERSEDDRDV
jgi:hypothetical protein